MAWRPGLHALLWGTPRADAFEPWRRAIGSAGERLVHTEEVTGSIPVSPTQLSGQFRARNWPFLIFVQQVQQ